MPRFAANLSMMFNEWDFLDRFAQRLMQASRGGIPVSLCPCAGSRELERAKLTQALFNLPPGNWDAGERGMACMPARREEFRASVDTALTYAKATGVKRLHMMSGHGDRNKPEARQAFTDALRHACEAAAPLGIDILIEPINGRDMPGYFMNDFGFAVGTDRGAGPSQPQAPV